MKLATAAHRQTTTSPTPPSEPRLRMAPTDSRRSILDGGWWPRSTDPVAELPGLILAIDEVHGPIIQLVLNTGGWDTHPCRLGMDGRVLRLGYFASQPVSLLTALCANGDRVDLLIVPPATESGIADTALGVAATTGNLVHSPDILPAADSA